MDWFRKLDPARVPVVSAIFTGRFRTIKYIATVLFLIGACIAGLGALAFTSLTSTAQYQVTGLQVQQQGTGLDLTWDDAGADHYGVFLQTNGERPRYFIADKNEYRVELDLLDQDYRVTVMAMNGTGGLSAAKSDEVATVKLEQTIETEKDKYVGLEDKSRDLEAEAHGKVTYESSNPKVVEVSDKGVMSFISDGRAEITMNVREGDQYKAARKTVPVTVYPDTLETPQLTVSKKKNTSVTLSWEPVEYAKGYTLRRLDPAKEKYRDLMDFSGETISVELPRDQAKYKLIATAEVGEDRIESDPSEEVKVKSAAEKADTYVSAYDLKTLDHSNLEVVASIDGSGRASVPQSMSKVGDKYVVTYVDHGGSTGALVAYNNEGQRLESVAISGMGHANGSTYNPNTDRIYTVRTHRQIRSATCSAYDPATGEMEKSFDLPRVTSGIAYDETNNKYILSKGRELYLCDDEFNVEKFVRKRARYNHAQDIGAYNGVAMVCTWVSGNTSYIDLYRTSDGGYLGSYNVPIGEIESCFVDNKYLIILMNNGTGGLGDCILRTAEPIELP